MSRPIPLTVLATVDPLLRDSAVFGLVTGGPRIVVLQHDILDGGDEGLIHRVVLDATGVLEDVLLPLEHACLSCAVREDALPTLRRLAADGRWEAIVLALPVSAESLPVSRALTGAARRGGDLSGMRLASVVGAVDVATCEKDLLDDELLAEVGRELTADDRRSIGEALVAQIAHVDVVAVAGEPQLHVVGSDLVEHLRAPDSLRIDGVHELDVHELMRARHDSTVAERRLDPLHARASEGPTNNGVWSIDLRSARPFHPERLVENVSLLGEGRLRSRGAFWAANRPLSACAWEGVGGQLSIGELGPWKGREPFTHLVYTGVGDEVPALRSAFEGLLVTPAELSAGLGHWLGREDVLEPWLGARSAAW